jgi:hypothetical protein
MASILDDDQAQQLQQLEAERRARALQAAIAPPSAMAPAALPAPVQPALPPAQPLIPPPTPIAPEGAGVTLPPVSPRVQADQTELDRLRSTGSGIDQLGRHSGFGHKLGSVLARIGDVAGTALFPTVAAAIPGTSLHHQVLLNRAQGNVESDQAEEDAAAQAAQRAALAKKAEAQGESFEPISLSPEQAAAIGHPELTGQDMLPRGYSMMLAGKQRGDVATSVAGTKAQSAKDVAETRAQSAKDIETAREQSRKDIADAANKTRMLLEEKRAATSTANTNARIAAKAPGAPGSAKVPADVTKRAALASNVLENSDAVEDILQRRPDIVGAAGGRYTNVQQLIGSDDPDIQALGVRIHNIALASNGAHGVRSFEAVRQTEDELFSHFKAGPHAIRGALQATRGSMQTFLDDERNFQTHGNRAGSAGGAGTPPAAAPQNVRVGQKVKLKNGETITIKVVHPDGSFE